MFFIPEKKSSGELNKPVKPLVSLSIDLEDDSSEMKEDLLGIFSEIEPEPSESEATAESPEEVSSEPEPAPSEEIKVDLPEPESVSTEDIASYVQSLIKALGDMNAGVIKRVEDLENSIKQRSSDIRAEAAESFDRAIERANKIHELAIKRSRDIKSVMYEAEIKDLELQKLQLDILNSCEDQSMDREKKMKDLFTNQGQ